MITKKQRLIYGAVTIVVSVFLSSGFAVWYTSVSNRHWCDTLVTLTAFDPNELPPGATDYGKTLRAAQVRQYDAFLNQMDRFGCKS